MKIRDCQVQPRQAHGQKGGDIADQPAETGDLRPVIVVVGGADKGVVIRRKDQADGRVVYQNDRLPLQHRHDRPVRPAGGLHLGEGREPLLLRQLLHHTALQNAVHLKILQALLDFPQKLRPDNPLHIDQIDQGVGPHSKLHLLNFQIRRLKTLAHQRRVDLDIVGKPLIAAPGNLLRLHILDHTAGIPLIRNLESPVKPVHKKHRVSGQNPLGRLLRRLVQRHIRESQGIFRESLMNFPGIHIRQPYQKISDGGGSEHDRGHGNLDVDQETGNLLILPDLHILHLHIGTVRKNLRQIGPVRLDLSGKPVLPLLLHPRLSFL